MPVQARFKALVEHSPDLHGVVQDDGMEKDVREHTFEPFFTTKGQGHNTGLGLAILELQGYRVWAARNADAVNMVTEQKAAFVPKPFTADVLARKVREALDG